MFQYQLRICVQYRVEKVQRGDGMNELGGKRESVPVLELVCWHDGLGGKRELLTGGALDESVGME